MSFQHVPYTSNAACNDVTGHQGTQGSRNFFRDYNTVNVVNIGTQNTNTIAPIKTSTSAAIASLEDLMNSREATLNKENADKKSLDLLISPTSDTFRTSLLQWAAKDFPSGYILHSINLNAPLVCSDGSSHDIGGYVLFLTKKSSEDIAKDIQSLMPGIKVFHSFLNSSIRIHISKL
jgi:hypothetical protein